MQFNLARTHTSARQCARIHGYADQRYAPYQRIVDSGRACGDWLVLCARLPGTLLLSRQKGSQRSVCTRNLSSPSFVLCNLMEYMLHC